MKLKVLSLLSASASAYDLFYPIVEVPIALECIQGIPAIEHPLYRASSGLRAFSMELQAMDTSILMNELPAERRLNAKRALNRPRRLAAALPPQMDWECPVRKTREDQTPIGDALCGCHSQYSNTQSCKIENEWLRITGCRSDWTPVCTSPTSNTYGVEIPEECQRGTTTDFTPESLYLRNMLWPRGASIPDTIDARNTAVEMSSYYTAFKGFERVHMWAETHWGCGTEVSEDVEVVKGWTNVYTFGLVEPGESGSIPLAVLSKKDDNYLLTFRDTMTSFESTLLSSYQHQYKASARIPGSVSYGLATIHDTYAPLLRLIFTRFAESNWSEDETELVHPKVTVVGSGELGAGLAALASVDIAMILGPPKYGSLFEIAAILFDAPKVGDAEFTAFYNTNVNGRNVQSPHSISRSRPCYTTPLCDRFTSQIATGVEGESVIHDTLKGQVVADMSEFDDAHEMWENPFAVGAHTRCGPGCYLSKKFCPWDTQAPCDPDTCPLMV